LLSTVGNTMDPQKGTNIYVCPLMYGKCMLDSKRQWGGPVVAYCKLQFSAVEVALPPGQIRQRKLDH
jgi:hypothetical protein